MVIGCAFKKNENGEYVVDNEETEKKWHEAFPEMSDAEKKISDQVEKELRETMREAMGES